MRESRKFIINGMVRGDIISDDEVWIDSNGDVEANIKAKNAVIAGEFKGDLKAEGHIHITSSGRFTGNLIQKRISMSISKGGFFIGKSIATGSRDII